MVENERRLYQRSRIKGEARVGRDGKFWREAVISDLSSTGIQVSCDEDYEINESLKLKLTLYGLASEFDVITDGVVRHRLFAKHHYVYGLEFTNLSRDTKIRIDEVINQMRPRHFTL